MADPWRVGQQFHPETILTNRERTEIPTLEQWQRTCLQLQDSAALATFHLLVWGLQTGVRDVDRGTAWVLDWRV